MKDAQDGSSAPPDWRALGAAAGLDERTLRSVCRRRRYGHGVMIFHEGDRGGVLHLVDRGHVGVRLTSLLGAESIIDVLGPGDTFGEQALIDGAGDRSASTMAIDDVETLTLDMATFHALRQSQPAVDRFLLAVLNRRLRATSAQLFEARYVSAERRLYRCLVRLADRFDVWVDGVIPLRQSDVASMAGVTRATANRLLRQAERDGLIVLGRSRLGIADAAEVRRRAALA